ncbi:hypothetical protein ACFLZZ_03995 [Nanoarchaeota archaeon]
MEKNIKVLGDPHKKGLYQAAKQRSIDLSRKLENEIVKPAVKKAIPKAKTSKKSRKDLEKEAEWHTNKSSGDLEEDVKEYFAKYIYEGYTKPFKLTRLEIDYSSEKCFAIPRGIRASIGEEDREWEWGLTLLGEKYALSLSLHKKCYRK